jgi:hypothetical protein
MLAAPTLATRRCFERRRRPRPDGRRARRGGDLDASASATFRHPFRAFGDLRRRATRARHGALAEATAQADPTAMLGTARTLLLGLEDVAAESIARRIARRRGGLAPSPSSSAAPCPDPHRRPTGARRAPQAAGRPAGGRDPARRRQAVADDSSARCTGSTASRPDVGRSAALSGAARGLAARAFDVAPARTYLEVFTATNAGGADPPPRSAALPAAACRRRRSP